VSAFAQSTVTLYGVADIAYGAKQFEKPDGSVVAKQTGVMDGGFAGNRIGFKGTEDIGNGQAVGFNIEQGISPTNGALFGVRTATAGLQYDGYAASTGKFDQGTTGGYSQGTNRQSFVSFADKSLGEVRVGYQYAAVYEVSTLMGFTTMSEGVVGGSSSHTHGQAVVGGTRANGIQYIAPRMGAFGAAVQVGSGAGRDTTEFNASATNTAAGTTQVKNKRTSLKLDYDQGPWKAAFATTSYRSATGAVAANGRLPTASTGTYPAATSVNTFNVYGALTGVGGNGAAESDFDAKLNQIAGMYTGSNWKVGYQRNSGTYNVTSEATPTMASSTAVSYAAYSKLGAYDIKSQRISGMYTIGKWDLIAGQGTASVDGPDAVRTMDLKEKQIGALYNLSKRSRVYFYQGQWTDSAAAATTYAKGKQSILGLAHSF
jgi:predicted porin